MYLVLSLQGRPVSRHRSLEACVKTIRGAHAERQWSVAEEGHAGPTMLSSEDRRRVNELMRA